MQTSPRIPGLAATVSQHSSHGVALAQTAIALAPQFPEYPPPTSSALPHQILVSAGSLVVIKTCPAVVADASYLYMIRTPPPRTFLPDGHCANTFLIAMELISEGDAHEAVEKG